MSTNCIDELADRGWTEPWRVVQRIGGKRLAIVNDTNFGSTGRNPSLPDAGDFIVVTVPGLDD